VHNISDFKQIEVHTAELLVLAPSSVEVEIVIAKSKKYKSTSGDQISAELRRRNITVCYSQIYDFCLE
jgi:hypothetical protein